MGTAKRWSQVWKKYIKTDQLCLIAMCNKHLGGVDLVDQGVTKFHVGIRIKKWWWRLFSWLINVSVYNACQIYRYMASKQILEKIGLSSVHPSTDTWLLNKSWKNWTIFTSREESCVIARNAPISRCAEEHRLLWHTKHQLKLGMKKETRLLL